MDKSPIKLARFWSRVTAGTDFQCWPWTGRRGPKGYGRHGREMAHRIAYELVRGSIPDGLLVRHRCDNPPCCNPKHLIVGTFLDNSRDCVERGRIATGEKNGRTKLTKEQAQYIRTNPDGLKLYELAKKFGIAPSTASYVRSGVKSWKYLENEVVGPAGAAPATPPM